MDYEHNRQSLATMARVVQVRNRPQKLGLGVPPPGLAPEEGEEAAGGEAIEEEIELLALKELLFSTAGANTSKRPTGEQQKKEKQRDVVVAAS